MNWSVLPTKASCAVQSQDQKRAVLLERALVAGSGLLSRGTDNGAQYMQEHRQPASQPTSPTQLRCPSVLSSDCHHISSAAHALPPPPESASFQHTVRGQSPGKASSVQFDDSTPATDPAELLTQPHGPTQLLKGRRKVLPSLPVRYPTKTRSKGQTQPSVFNTFETSDENAPQTLACQALAALSDSHDRSKHIEDAALSPNQDRHASAEIADLTLESSVRFEDDGTQWLATILQEQLVHSTLLLHDHERPLILLRLPDGAAHCPGNIPFTWTDPASSTETYILAPPSEHPSNRRDALAVQALLGELLQNPSQAFEMAASWRATMVGPSSPTHAEACVSGPDAVRHRSSASTHSPSPGSRTASRLSSSSLARSHPNPPCNTSKQSSRSPSTLPYIASRSPSSRSMYQEPLGHPQLPHRAPQQDSKQDRSGTTQHHVRPDCHSGEDIGWKLYCTASFTTSLFMVMAELAKQVEVHCSERAHALALTWNLYSAAMDTCQGCLQAEVHQLSRVNAAVTAENMQMKHELQQAHSTQQELVVSKQAESIKLALERESAQLAAAMSELHTAQQEAQTTRHHLQRRLALARWQFAGAAVTLPNPTALIPSTPARPVGPHSPGLVRKAQALERMTGGRSAAQKELAALKAERAVKKGVANLRQDGTAGDAFSAAVRGAQQRQMHDVHGLLITARVAEPEAVMKMLSPEAQAGTMSGLNSQQRQQLYAMISDDTLAGMLVAMRSAERTKLLQEVEQLDQTLMDRALRYIRLRPGLASKWLAAMSPAEALAETEQMTATSVSAALSAMKPWQAAEIVQGLPKEDQRQLLLSVPFTHMSNILQALPGQACIDALLSIGAPLCKDLLLSMPSAASKKLLHAASLTDLAKLIKDLDVDDASLITGMLAPSRLSQLTQFVGLAGPPQQQVDEPSLTISSLQGLSMDDKVATLSALQPSTAAAILGALSRPWAAALLASISSETRSDVAAQLDPLTAYATASELRRVPTRSIGRQDLIGVMRDAAGLPHLTSSSKPPEDTSHKQADAEIPEAAPEKVLDLPGDPELPETTLKSSMRRSFPRSTKTAGFDKRRGLAGTSTDKRRGIASDKGLARTKSMAPAAASKNLVKWSAKEASAGPAKNPLQMRASRESSIMSESPRSSVSGDSFDIESVSSATSHGSFMSVVRAAKLAADQPLGKLQGIAAKLGAGIRNQRLADIVAHRPQAAVRSLKWLIGILDNVLKQTDASLRKGSKLLSVPDLVFGAFQRKYGDLMASEYMASLVNSVARYRLEDERIELFSHFLTEEWNEALLVALGTVYRLSEGPCPFPCIEYPAPVDNTLVKSSRQMDLAKAVWVSDCVLGDRSPETRAAFISQLQQVSTEAAPEDAQWLVSRPAGNAEASSGPQLFKGQPTPVPPPAAVLDARRASRVTTEASSAYSHGWKLKRVSLMKLVCFETARMEAVRVQQLPYVFQRLPLNPCGNLPLSEVHDFIEEALPANSGVNDTALQQLVDRFIAEGIAAQTASEGLASQTSMSLDAFFAASHTSQVVKDYVKLTMTGPAGEMEEAQSLEELRNSHVAVLVARHFEAMWVHLREGIGALPVPHHRLTDQAVRVTQEQRGSLKLEAYLRLLQDMIVLQLQQASVMHSASPQSSELEAVLSRVEDAVLLLQGNPYLLAEKGLLLQARRRRSPPTARVEGVKALTSTYKQIQDSFAEQIVIYLQTAWRRYAARKQGKIVDEQHRTARTSTFDRESRTSSTEIYDVDYPDS